MIVAQYPHTAAERWPSEVAAIHGSKRLSYAELSHAIHTCSDRLEKLGLQSGDIIGIEAPDSIEFIVLVFAALSLGATVLPISPYLTDSELVRLHERIGLNALVISRVPHIALQKRCTFDVSNDYSSYFCKTGTPQSVDLKKIDQPAFIRFTSGTTGTSKGVLISHQSVHERTACAYSSLAMDAGDTMCWVLPMAYHFIVSLVMYVRYGVTIDIRNGYDAKAIIDCIQSHKRCFLYAAPDHYQRLLAYKEPQSLPTLVQAISTSSSLSHYTAEAFEKLYKTPISQIYGIIEIGLPAGNLSHAIDKQASIGKAFEGYTVAILDDEGTELPSPYQGQLAIKGPGMFDAYLCPFRSRNDVLQDGWFLTGDTAWKDADGYVTVEGRRSSVIHIEDKKVFPEEIEHVLDRHDSIQQSRVYGTRDANGRERIVAEIVRSASCVDTDTIRSYCEVSLAPWKIPQEFHFVQSLQKTATGKVIRTAAQAATLAA